MSGKQNQLSSMQMDIRIGRIMEIRRHPEADKLFVESIDFGTEVRTILSGLVDDYQPDDLIGELVMCICNLKPKPLKGIASHGMVLCTSRDNRFEVVRAPPGTSPGTRVAFNGNLSPTFPEVISSAFLPQLLAGLRTDANGAVCWNGEFASVPAGPLISSVCNAPIS
jgi:methionine--tRNA ligase beta chain